MKPNVWDQLKSITSGELISALQKVSIHSHSHKTYYPGQLKGLFKDIGWTEQDLKRLKLIK